MWGLVPWTRPSLSSSASLASFPIVSPPLSLSVFFVFRFQPSLTHPLPIFPSPDSSLPFVGFCFGESEFHARLLPHFPFSSALLLPKNIPLISILSKQQVFFPSNLVFLSSDSFLLSLSRSVLRLQVSLPFSLKLTSSLFLVLFSFLLYFMRCLRWFSRWICCDFSLTDFPFRRSLTLVSHLFSPVCEVDNLSAKGLTPSPVERR